MARLMTVSVCSYDVPGRSSRWPFAGSPLKKSNQRGKLALQPKVEIELGAFNAGMSLS